MTLFAYLAAEHRRIEGPLELFLQALLAGATELEQEAFRQARELAARHFELEEGILFAAVREAFAGLIGKMEAQHETVREAAGAFEAAAAGRRDRLRLGRYFQAMLQHHLIEEERDVFPLLVRFLDASRQAALLERFRNS